MQHHRPPRPWPAAPSSVVLRACAGLLALALLGGGLAGCKGMVWDPSARVSSAQGHQTDPDRPRGPTGPLRDDTGVEIGDETRPDSIRPGTGAFVRRVTPPPVDTSAGDVTLNFDGQDIREVVKVILGDLLGLSYVIDPAVTGNASLSTGRPLRREMLIPTLETLLRMNGAALVDQGGRYEVVPIANAIQGRVLPQLGESARALPEGYSVQVVPLRYIGAEEMANILQPLAPEGAVVRTDTLRNLLIIAGNSPEMTNLLDTIGLFDVDWMSGLSVGLFTLEYAKAVDVVSQLEALLADEGGGSPAKGLFRFIPVESANALIVVSPQQNYLNQMEDWIRRLDLAEATGGTSHRLFVYRVRHGDAGNLAKVLTQLFGGESGERAGTAQRSVGGVAPGLRQVSMGDETGRGTGLGRQRTGLGDTGVGAGGGEERESVASTVQLTSQVNIVSDAVNNSLLIRSSPQDYKRILEALKQLDITPLQVLIEATIVEVRLTGELRYGVQWRFFGTATDDHRSDVSLRTDNDGPARTFPGFNWSVVLRPDTIRLTLSALASDDLVNVLSSPSVMVLDNQQARIQVGEEVPVATSQQQGTSTTDRVLNQIEYREVGVILTVTPRVTPGGLVQMEIEQEVSTVAEQTGPLNSPTFRTRNITSNVAVRSNQAVVLGGLIQDANEGGKNGVPGLYRTPILGPLFGETNRKSQRTELIVVLTPRVIASDADLETVTNDFRRKVKNLDTRF